MARYRREIQERQIRSESRHRPNRSRTSTDPSRTPSQSSNKIDLARYRQLLPKLGETEEELDEQRKAEVEKKLQVKEVKARDQRALDKLESEHEQLLEQVGPGGEMQRPQGMAQGRPTRKRPPKIETLL